MHPIQCCYLLVWPSCLCWAPSTYLLLGWQDASWSQFAVLQLPCPVFQWITVLRSIAFLFFLQRCWLHARFWGLLVLCTYWLVFWDEWVHLSSSLVINFDHVIWFYYLVALILSEDSWRFQPVPPPLLLSSPLFLVNPLGDATGLSVKGTQGVVVTISKAPVKDTAASMV